MAESKDSKDAADATVQRWFREAGVESIETLRADREELRAALATAEGRASALDELLDAAERAVRVWPNQLRDSQLTTAIARARESAPATGAASAVNAELLAALEGLLPEGWGDGTMDHMPGVLAARTAIANARRATAPALLTHDPNHDTLHGFGGDDVHQVRDDVAAGGLEVKP